VPQTGIRISVAYNDLERGSKVGSDGEINVGRREVGKGGGEKMPDCKKTTEGRKGLTDGGWGQEGTRSPLRGEMIADRERLLSDLKSGSFS